jgi:plasmid stabilization system protein ParE
MRRTSKPRIVFTVLATRDIDRCRLFLERKGVSHPERHIRAIYAAARMLRDSPKLYPVEEIHAVSGLEFRRKNVGQFALLYAFLDPSPLHPRGLVSIRRVRHGAEEDVMLRVEERRREGIGVTRGLSTRHDVSHWRY